MKRVSEMLNDYVAVLGLSLLTLCQTVLAGEAPQLEPAKPEVKIESANHKFAEQYPLQYNSWVATAESTEATPALEEDPRLVILWSGYAFAKEYNKPRGHFYAITDVRSILRTGAPMDENSGPQSMACWTCKGPDVPRLIAEKGELGYFDAKWAKYGAEMANAIGCADCHDTTSEDFKAGKPALRIARPHVLRALETIGWKFDTLDKHGKRVAICANCHVEYYFAGKEKVVTFPWDKGVDVESMEKYYDELQFADWTHALSKAPMLKAQHPDFELWSLGTHGKNGVTCIDCHMPKVETKDGKVYTDHKIGNPFDNFEHTCKTCHEQSKATLQTRVKEHKKQIKDVMGRLEDQLVKAHFEAKAAWEAGATEAEMKEILTAIRHAQWRWDYAAASHGGYVHAPDEELRVLGTGLDRVAEARTQLAVVLTKHGVKTPIQFPDISTREKAQKVIGLDIAKEQAAKDEFLRTVVPQWEKAAQQKGLLPADKQ